MEPPPKKRRLHRDYNRAKLGLPPLRRRRGPDGEFISMDEQLKTYGKKKQPTATQRKQSDHRRMAVRIAETKPGQVFLFRPRVKEPEAWIRTFKSSILPLVEEMTPYRYLCRVIGRRRVAIVVF